MTAKATGRCLCGAVRYEFELPPLWVVHCHCESCRRHVSGVVATFVGIARERFRFTAGMPQSFQSSPGVRRSFCGNCGSPVAYEADRVPDEVHLYAGTLDDPGALAPEAHVHFEERVPWFETLDHLPRYRAGRRGGEHPLAIGPIGLKTTKAPPQRTRR
jgi:hypothetical protein